MTRKRALGKGLGSLLQSARVAEEIEFLQQPQTAEQSLVRDKTLQELPVEIIERGRYQPRRDMSPEALEELASSIRKQGVMQPIVVRPVGEPGEERYEIIAGERRWRATQLAGLNKIPAVIRDVPDDAAIAMALIENIQREDLNPLEEAMALARLKDEFELTQQEVADAVGKSRVTVTNLLRLLNLSPDARRMLEHGDIDAGHGKVILALPEHLQLQAAREVAAQGLSVRQTESLVRRIQQEAEGPILRPEKFIDPDIHTMEEELARLIGRKVVIQYNAKGKGKLVISYNSRDELKGVLSRIR